ncbi:transposase [Anabaena azotica]|uniref:Transposase n=1 Tax=Anabaena azotica FACHB-119 TaxID=947527 RepID=A0ABR8DEW0_9NOST|nr:transposase [Anabaena azotica]MBD2505589.1 transposase [Anabaena azotica FACHB-119]
MNSQNGKLYLSPIFSRRKRLTMKTKAQYKVKNWNAYDAALKQRGSIRFWVNEEVIEQWRNQQKTGRKGASNYYSDTALLHEKKK